MKHFTCLFLFFIFVLIQSISAQIPHTISYQGILTNNKGNPVPDPEHKYLNQQSVESSEMKNVYDGDVVIDRNGEAVVSLPEWFQALNKDYSTSLHALVVMLPFMLKKKFTLTGLR